MIERSIAVIEEVPFLSKAERRDRREARAAVGFTVKSGWASAVLVVGSGRSPRVADSRRVELSDPEIPESRQPYHAGFGTARSRGRELSRLVASVKRFGGKSVAALIRDYEAAGHRPQGAGVIVGSLIDPERIANEHVRIHAREERLFREVVVSAATRTNVPCLVLRHRDLYAFAAEALNRQEPQLRLTLTTLGKSAGGPWRAEEKAAALAAWLVLTPRCYSIRAANPRSLPKSSSGS